MEENNVAPVNNDIIKSKMRDVHSLGIVRVPKNCILIKESRIGSEITFEGKGLKVALPFLTKKTMLDLTPFPIECKVEGKATTTIGEIDISGEAVAWFEFAPESLDEDVNFYTNTAVESGLKKDTIGIINQLIATFDLKGIMSKQNVFIRDIRRVSINNNKYDEFIKGIDEIREKYGLFVRNIDLTKVYSPSTAEYAEEKKQAEHKRELQLIEADSKLKVAKQEAEAIKTTADAEAYATKVKGIAQVDIAKQQNQVESDKITLLLNALANKGFEPSDIIYYLTRLATNGNAIIVEGKTIDTSTMLMARDQLQKQIDFNAHEKDTQK